MVRKTDLALGTAVAVSLVPVGISALGIAEETQKNVSELCIGWVSEDGKIRGILPEGPLGMSLDIYQNDFELYYDIIKSWSDQEFADDSKGYSNPDEYFTKFYIPENRLYETDSVFSKVLSVIPKYTDVKQLLTSFYQKDLPMALDPMADYMDTKFAESFAHATIGISLLIATSLATTIIDRGKRRKSLFSNDLESAIDNMSDIERRHLLQTLSNPEKFLAAFSKCLSGAKEISLSATEKAILPIIKSVGILSIVAAAAPSVGMGAVTILDIFNTNRDILRFVAESMGTMGHEMSENLSGGILALLSTHTVTCVAPSALLIAPRSASALANYIFRKGSLEKTTTADEISPKDAKCGCTEKTRGDKIIIS